MKLENQVCSITQAKRLKELGIIQESFFSYFKCTSHAGICNSDMSTRHVWILTGNPYYTEDIELTAAFTVAELGAMLSTMTCNLRKSDNGDYWYAYLDTYQQFKTEAEGRAALLIFRLERKAITVDEVNHLLISA